jgi:deoxycytidine triphosphate deaminase
MATTPHPAQSVFILRYEDIEEEVRQGRLISHHVASSIEPSSYDLRVGTVFREGQIINEEHRLAGQQFVIEPGEIVSLLTLEELILPSDTIAIAFPMNKWSSEGLLVLNPGFVDPGYNGPLSVKIVNLRKTRISISRSQPIFTVSFFRIGAHTTHPYSRNKSRREKEAEMNTRELEQSAGSISELLKSDPDRPYTTEHDVERLLSEQPFMTSDQIDTAIRNHWMTRLTFVAAIVAAIAAMIPLLKGH